VGLSPVIKKNVSYDDQLKMRHPNKILIQKKKKKKKFDWPGAKSPSEVV
jgi:hypothetical protein